MGISLWYSTIGSELAEEPNEIARTAGQRAGSSAAVAVVQGLCVCRVVAPNRTG